MCVQINNNIFFLINKSIFFLEYYFLVKNENKHLVGLKKSNPGLKF